VDKTLVDPAVKAIDAMIDAELHSSSPARYSNIAKLCGHAHALSQMAPTRVEDIAEPVADEYGGIAMMGDNYHHINFGDNEFEVGRPLPRLGGHVGDQADVARELIAAVQAPKAPAPLTISAPKAPSSPAAAGGGKARPATPDSRCSDV